MRIFKENNVTMQTRLDSENVRELCIRKRYYTKGNVQQYTDMLSFCNKDTVCENDILTIAYDIAVHSNSDLWEGATFKEFVQNIMFELDRNCLCRSYSINDGIEL